MKRGPSYKFSDEEVADVIRLGRKGLSSRAVAEELGLPLHLVSGLIGNLRRNGTIPRRGENARTSRAMVERRCLGGCGGKFKHPDPPAIRRICPKCADQRETRRDYLPDCSVAL